MKGKRRKIYDGAGGGKEGGDRAESSEMRKEKKGRKERWEEKKR